MSKFNLEDHVVRRSEPDNLGVVIRTPDMTENGQYEVEFHDEIEYVREEELVKR